MPRGFLIQQLEWREALDEASSKAELEALAAEVAGHRQAALQRLETLLDLDRDFPRAAQEVRALMFTERFVHDVDRRLDALEQ